MNRRQFLRAAGLTAAAASLRGRDASGDSRAGASFPGNGARVSRAGSAAADEQPNILVIMVDQMREPKWFGASEAADERLANLRALRDTSVRFRRHYTAANMCRPARSSLLTGLYTHQTWVLLTAIASGAPPSLHPGFPTWGSALRTQGYATYWYGKWHLSEEDLGPYGFAGGTYPSPNGAPVEGYRRDPDITAQFQSWFADHRTEEPWCTTVSYVNPHDISWFYRGTDPASAESSPPSAFSLLPDNFETPTRLADQGKPRLQRALQEMAAVALGRIPYGGRGFETDWLRMLDLYLQLQVYVDVEIGRVLSTLAADPAVANRTIVIFTADHGEYAGSHGMRGKGGGLYEEAVNVPLYVRDPTGLWTDAPGDRSQLTSSVDIMPLLLTLAAGGAGWREQPELAHLAHRADLGAILRDGSAAGRAFALHATDEELIEQSPHTRYATDVPSHAVAYITQDLKLGSYRYWESGTTNMAANGEEIELYDYTSDVGRLEMENVAMANPELQDAATRALTDAIASELRAPLGKDLEAAQAEAHAAYLEAADSRSSASPIYVPSAETS